MAETKQLWAKEPFAIGMNHYEVGSHFELPFETDEEKANIDSLIFHNLVSVIKVDPRPKPTNTPSPKVGLPDFVKIDPEIDSALGEPSTPYDAGTDRTAKKNKKA